MVTECRHVQRESISFRGLLAFIATTVMTGLILNFDGVAIHIILRQLPALGYASTEGTMIESRVTTSRARKGNYSDLGKEKGSGFFFGCEIRGKET